MRSASQDQPAKLEELPNIGKSISSDLRAIGIFFPQQIAERDPHATYIELGGVMGHCHDPCVLCALLSEQHFLESGEALLWWTFNGEGKAACLDFGRRVHMKHLQMVFSTVWV